MSWEEVGKGKVIHIHRRVYKEERSRERYICVTVRIPATTPRMPMYGDTAMLMRDTSKPRKESPAERSIGTHQKRDGYKKGP